MIERAKEMADIFKPVLKKVQQLPAEVRRYFAQERLHRSKRNEALEEYAAKQDFRKTAEPKPGVPRRSAQGSDNRDKWRLIRSSKNTRAVSKKRDDESALTKRTMTQIATAADAVWQSNRR